MREDGQFGSQRAIKQHLLGRVRQMVRAANHVGDTHIDVINHHAQLVGWHAPFFAVLARAQQHEILDFLVVKFAFAKYLIAEDRLARRNPEADRWFGVWRRGLTVAARTSRHPAHLFRGGAAFRGMIAASILFGGAVAEERAAIGQAFLGRLAVQIEPLGLQEWAFIPIHAQPGQAVDNSLHQFRLVALRVGIFHAQNHRPTLLARDEPVT
jgi:hypothetical protein